MSVCDTDLVQLAGYSTDDGLVSEVKVEPFKVHLPVDPFIAVRLRLERRKQDHESRVQSTSGWLEDGVTGGVRDTHVWVQLGLLPCPLFLSVFTGATPLSTT